MSVGRRPFVRMPPIPHGNRKGFELVETTSDWVLQDTNESFTTERPLTREELQKFSRELSLLGPFSVGERQVMICGDAVYQNTWFNPASTARIRQGVFL